MGQVVPLRRSREHPRLQVESQQREAQTEIAHTQSWNQFRHWFAREWAQGEHVTIIGPTGTGKTTLALSILGLRDYVVAFASKRKDDTMEKLLHSGYRQLGFFTPDIWDYIVVWPPVDSASAMDEQKEVFDSAINSILRSGGWCTFWDEAAYLSDDLGLRKPMRMLWQQGRSLGVSIVAATQRPAFIPVTAYDSATHLFFFKDNDERNLSRIGGLGGLAAGPIRNEVAQLEKHEILYLNTRTGERIRTKVE